MNLDRDKLLLESFKKSLDFYQKSLVWAMTASAVFCLLTLNLRDPHAKPVDLSYGQLSTTAAWGVAIPLFFVLGILAAASLGNTIAIVKKMALQDDDLKVLLLYPSMATVRNRFVRIGSALLPPVAVFAAFLVEKYREPPMDIGTTVIGMFFIFCFIFSPYLAIVNQLRSHFFVAEKK